MYGASRFPILDAEPSRNNSWLDITAPTSSLLRGAEKLESRARGAGIGERGGLVNYQARRFKDDGPPLE